MVQRMALLAGSLLAAEPTPKDDVISAAKKLGEKANYSWRTTVVVPDGLAFGPAPWKQDGEGRVSPWSPDLLAITPGNLSAKRQGGFEHSDGGWQSLAELEQEEGRGRFRALMARNFRVPRCRPPKLPPPPKN